MSGHSHWSGIKRKKALLDSKKAKVFTKLGRAIVVASRLGGPNPEFNPALRLAIQKAKEANMPKDRVENLVKKAGDRENAELEELLYEAVGPFGTMLMITVITDKKNRTVSELRKSLEDHGGKLADGGVGWNFRRAGFIDLLVEEDSKEIWLEKIMELGVDDFEERAENRLRLIVDLAFLNEVRNALSDAKIDDSGVGYFPKTRIKLTMEEKKLYNGLIEELEENLDVQEVFDNVL